jgi:hypothetical protein
VVRAAAGLGQAAADQVADRQQRDVVPGLVGEEDIAAAVGVADQERRDQDSGDGDEVDDELGRLNRGLRLGARAVSPSVDLSVVQGVAGRAERQNNSVIRIRVQPRRCGPGESVLGWKLNSSLIFRLVPRWRRASQEV